LIVAEVPNGARAPVRVLHISDIHCGHPFREAHVQAALAVARASAWTAIVISGDLSQRARDVEFVAARAVVDQFRALAPVLVVPGNHDAAWWRAPFGRGDVALVHAGYRAHIDHETEPTRRLPGLSLIGLNSAWGTHPPSLTWYPRDWRVKGGLTTAQLSNAHARLAASAPGDLRLLVVHHNVVRGRLSNRWGLARPVATLDAIAAMPVDVVCTGHDHEERIEVVERGTGQFLLSAANTLSSRMRGHRPSALNVIEATATHVTATAWVYDAATSAFTPSSTTATQVRRSPSPSPTPR
jgi:3',5'-cyclic AMP phosphodiesterase CpdA